MKPRRGMLVAEALMTLALLAAITLALTTCILSASKTRAKLDDQARTLVVAEQVLADLRQGRRVPAKVDGAAVIITPASTPAPAGRRWVDVEVRFNGQRATLTGAVPKEALP